jgi:hypothetical protein
MEIKLDGENVGALIYQQLHARLISLLPKAFVSGWQQSSELSRLIVRCARRRRQKVAAPFIVQTRGKKGGEKQLFLARWMQGKRQSMHIHQSAGAQVELQSATGADRGQQVLFGALLLSAPIYYYARRFSSGPREFNFYFIAPVRPSRDHRASKLIAGVCGRRPSDAVVAPGAHAEMLNC